MARAQDDISNLLARMGEGGGAQAGRLLPLVYTELRGLAGAYLRRQRRDHTLQATALVHEAYMRLAERDDVAYQDRGHFFRAAAKTMRHVLLNHAERRGALKRGGGRGPLRLEETAALAEIKDLDLLALEEALTRLTEVDEQAGQVVELRFFGGCTISEAAQCLNISTSAVERDWRAARAWLRSQMAD